MNQPEESGMPMNMKQLGIKLKKSKSMDNGYHQYSLSYKIKPNQVKEGAYRLLSAFVGNHDVVMELDTDLFEGLASNVQATALKFSNDLASLNVVYSCREVPSNRKVGLLGFITESKKQLKALKIAAYIPNHIWTSPSFMDILPVCGARYYIPGEPMDARTIVNNLSSLTEDRKAEQFSMILFNMATYAHIGIISAHASEEDLRNMLGSA